MRRGGREAPVMDSGACGVRVLSERFQRALPSASCQALRTKRFVPSAVPSAVPNAVPSAVEI